jgi:CheY-like chemotaxis protein
MRGKTILIVEDDRDELDVAVRALRRSNVGFEVAIARDGQQALNSWESTPTSTPR